jgi:hypothetical protein
VECEDSLISSSLKEMPVAMAALVFLDAISAVNVVSYSFHEMA